MPTYQLAQINLDTNGEAYFGILGSQGLSPQAERYPGHMTAQVAALKAAEGWQLVGVSNDARGHYVFWMQREMEAK